jgi:hypothetical protein
VILDAMLSTPPRFMTADTYAVRVRQFGAGTVARCAAMVERWANLS